MLKTFHRITPKRTLNLIIVGQIQIDKGKKKNNNNRVIMMHHTMIEKRKKNAFLS